MTAAAERLALSRQRLRQALKDMDKAAATPSGARPVSGNRAFAWLDRLHSIPGADALRHWWAGSPVRTVFQLVANTADMAVHPMAQRHPFGLVVGAAVVGVALAWSRPWRWILTPALLAGLLPRMLSQVVGGVPAATWVSLLGVLASRVAARRAGQTGTGNPF